MRFSLIYKAFSTILFALSLSLIFPFIYSLVVKDNCAKDFLIPFLLSFILFLPTVKLEFQPLNLKEALIVVAGVWFLFPALSSVVYILGAHIQNPVDAYFESVSGFTTTGATILSNIEALPPSVLLWRSLTQWLGGLGFIVFSFSLLPFIRTSYSLVKFEASKILEERITPNVREVIKVVITFYILLTCLEIIILKILGLSWYQAINHAFTTISTGGFSPKNESIKAFHSPLVEFTIIVFMLLGSINLMIYERSWREKKPFLIFSYFETKSLLIISFVAIALATGNLWINHFYNSFWEDIRYASFQVVSALTTTGFASDDFNTYPPFVKSLLMFLTILGGSAGSTAGGIKQFRLLILSQILHGEIKKTLHPRIVIRYTLGKKVIDINLLSAVLSFVFVYGLTIITFGILLTLGGHDIITSFSASIACLTSFGPGLGKVGPMDNFNIFSDWQKILLSIEMIMGRLEILPVVSLVYLVASSFNKKI
jgi:trk system potassium uptake protein TrkH